MVGARTTVKIVKNKVAPPFKQVEFDILYGEGICSQGELVDLGADLGVIEKSGAWFSFNGEKIGQGRDKVIEYLKKTPAIAQDIKKKIYQIAGLSAAASPQKKPS